MKILFLLSSMGNGGAERVASILCNEWVKIGHEVTLVPTFSQKGPISYTLDPRVKLIFLADQVVGHKGKIKRLIALYRLFKQEKPNVAISFLTNVNIPALLLGIVTKIPVIVSERTYPPLLIPPLSNVTKLLRKALYRKASAVVVQTSDTADWLRLNCGKCKVSIIPNPISASQISRLPASINEDKKLILGVGRLVPSKRFDLLLDSFHEISKEINSSWKLAIVGEGPDRKKLESRIAEFNLMDKVLLPGHSLTPVDWYSKASIFVLPSQYEGMPNTLLEALANGIPSIAFDVKTGPKEILENGKIGILLPDNDQKTRLTGALKKLINDPALRDKLKTCSTSVLQDYSINVILKKWDQLIKNAIKNNNHN